MELAPDFNEFVESLIAHGVEFVVCAGRPKDLADIDALDPAADLREAPELKLRPTGGAGAKTPA